MNRLRQLRRLKQLKLADKYQVSGNPADVDCAVRKRSRTSKESNHIGSMASGQDPNVDFSTVNFGGCPTEWEMARNQYIGATARTIFSLPTGTTLPTVWGGRT